MARKAASTISQEELYPASSEPIRNNLDDLDDARLLDLDAEQESPFLRGQKRVSVRRGSFSKKSATRLTWAILALGVVCLTSLGVGALYHYGEHSWRFRVESSDDIEITGLENVTRGQVMEVMGGDIGRNIFFIPLSERKKSLEKIPWVESASVMRFVPNRVKIEIHQRTPVAFARMGSRIFLVDATGAVMDLPFAHKKKYSFPVILGMNLNEPRSTSAPRMKLYNDLIAQFDSGGGHYSQDLSEVDISDPEDVKVLVNDPQGEVLVHLGAFNYLDRYKIYRAHVQEWRQQFPKLESVDLRYDNQIVVNPDLQGAEKQPPLLPAAARAAISAGVKPAALITHVPAATTSAADSSSATPVNKSVKPATHKVPAKRRIQPAARRVKLHPTTTSPKTPAAPPPAAAQTAQQKTNSGPAASPATNAAPAGKKPSPAISKAEANR